MNELTQALARVRMVRDGKSVMEVYGYEAAIAGDYEIDCLSLIDAYLAEVKAREEQWAK